ncbi:MAG: thiol-activated cytolysin family protein [Gemmatimonadetes bacterium]|nr:thiol-activated cytolysin family protein [Gemmatimonadota bacterium]
MTRLLRLTALAGLSVLAACGTDSTGPDGGIPKSPDAAKIESIITALPGVGRQHAVPTGTGRPSGGVPAGSPGSDFMDYKCDVSNLNTVKPFNRVLSAGSNLSNLYPGALIEGKTLRGGSPAVITSLARAPMTLRISLPLGNQSIEVKDVNSVTMAQAIADLQRRGATEQGVKDVILANMVFELTEANTFDQSMTAVGVSAGYSNPLKGIDASGNINSSNTRSVKTNSVVVKFVQEMYTINVAEDLLPKGSDFFAASVREADLQALVASGKFGPDNIPLYIESITYGRALFFSARSTDVIDVNELKAAMNVAGGAFGGGATSPNDSAACCPRRTTRSCRSVARNRPRRPPSPRLTGASSSCPPRRLPRSRSPLR